MHGNPHFGREIQPPPDSVKRGRPKGRLNDVTLEARTMALEIVRDPTYRANLLKRAQDGTLGPMEPVLWSYCFGKPKDQPSFATEDLGLLDLSDAELAARAELIASVLRATASSGEAASAAVAALDLLDEPSRETVQ